MMSKTLVSTALVLCVAFAGNVASAEPLGPLNLLVDPSGEAWIVNPSTEALGFEGYQISSVVGNLNPAGWYSLTDRGEPGWEVLSSSDTLLAEAVGVISTDFYTLDPGGSVSLGSPVDAETPLEDLDFLYTSPDGELFEGTVVPEPTTLGLLSLAGLVFIRRR
ncbi:MAG: PEP-CTERM sorting domain-containing protein [Phycisphaerae bacterium]